MACRIDAKYLVDDTTHVFLLSGYCLNYSPPYPCLNVHFVHASARWCKFICLVPLGIVSMIFYQCQRQKKKKNPIYLWHHGLIFQILSVQQLYRICTLYWDDNYNTRSVSPDVSFFLRISSEMLIILNPEKVFSKNYVSDS